MAAGYVLSDNSSLQWAELPSKSYKIYNQIRNEIKVQLDSQVLCEQLFVSPENFSLKMEDFAIPGKVIRHNRRIEFSPPKVLSESADEKVLMVKLSISERNQVGDLYYLKIFVAKQKSCSVFL